MLFNKLSTPKANKPANPLRNSCPCNFDHDAKSVMKSLITIKCWDLLTKLIHENPGFAKIYIEVTDNGKSIERFPIHEICRNKPPLELVRVLVHSYHNSLKLRDVMNGSLPIHIACRFGASQEVIKYLLRKNPESAYIEDKYGCTPLIVAKRSSYRHRDEIVSIFDTHLNSIATSNEKKKKITFVANCA